jgi:hypothetical protein
LQATLSLRLLSADWTLCYSLHISEGHLPLRSRQCVSPHSMYPLQLFSQD